MPRFEVKDGTGFNMNYEVIPGLVPQNTLFIHGNLASNRWWQPMVRELSATKGLTSLSGKVVLAEFRGCGQSSAPRSPDEVDMHRFADDMIALVEAEKLTPVHLVGHSTGGFIACLMMIKRPELFGRMVLLDSVGPRGVRFEPSMEAAFEQMKGSKEIVSAVMTTTIHNNNPADEFFQKAIVEDAFLAVKTTGWPVVKSLGNIDIREDLGKIRADVLVIHGEKDVVIPLEDSFELARAIPGAQHIVLKEHGHSMNVENPRAFADLMSTHLFVERSTMVRAETAQ